MGRRWAERSRLSTDRSMGWPTVVVALASLTVGLVGCSSGDDDGSSGAPGNSPELAATPEFCVAAGDLIGAMESVGVADPSVPEQVELAYTDTADRLEEVALVAPNAGVANQIGETTGLFLPLVEMLSEADWDATASDTEAAEELAVLQERSGPELDRLTGEFEEYVAEQCALDVDQARANGVERFYDALIERAGDDGEGSPGPGSEAPGPDEPDEASGSGSADGSGGGGSGPRPGDQALVDEASIGERGGDVFCAADRLWLAAIGDTDRADDITIVGPVLALADRYTAWGERLPVDLAVSTVDLNVGFAEVVSTYGETQDGPATREEYLRWRNGPGFAEARAAVDAWVDENCS